jgi:hypothetical protein
MTSAFAPRKAELLEQGLREILAAIQAADRAYRRLAVSESRPLEPASAHRLLTHAKRNLHAAERSIASVLSGSAFADESGETAELYWIHPATRQTEVLNLLREIGEAPAAEIGRRTGLQRSRVISICHRLTRRGFVRARHDPDYRGRRLLFSAVQAPSAPETT